MVFCVDLSLLECLQRSLSDIDRLLISSCNFLPDFFFDLSHSLKLLLFPFHGLEQFDRTLKLPHLTNLPHPCRYLARMLTQLLRAVDPLRSLCLNSFLHQRQPRFNCLQQKWVILKLIDEFDFLCAVVFGLGATRVLKTHLLRVCPLFLLKLPLAISDISHMLTVVIECVVVNATLDLAHARTNIRHRCLLLLVDLITSLVLLSESLISFLL